MKKLPKFKTIYLQKRAPTHRNLKKLIRWCSRFEAKGLAPAHPDGTHGNLSFRVSRNKNEFLITASGLKFKSHLCRDSFFRVRRFDLKKKAVWGCGLKLPSSETLLHGSIYKRRPDVMAIFHGHSPEILLKAKEGLFIQTPREAPYGSLRLVQNVLKVLREENYLVMRNHGFLSLGSTLDHAGNLALRMLRK